MIEFIRPVQLPRVCPRCGTKSYADRCSMCRDEPLLATQVPCPDCYGGHFRPCNVCGDSGVAWLVEVREAEPKEDGR